MTQTIILGRKRWYQKCMAYFDIVYVSIEDTTLLVINKKKINKIELIKPPAVLSCKGSTREIL